jgi:glycosyltransferase involved in cell wall biosynthesis
MILSNPATYDTRPIKEAKALVSEGHRVTILSWDRNGGAPRLSVSGLMEIKRFPLKAPYGQNWVTLLGFALFYVWSAFSALTTKYEAVHCHDVDTLPLGIFFKIFRRHLRLVYDMHDHPLVFLNAFAFSNPLINLLFIVCRKMLDFIVVVNDGFIGYLTNKGFARNRIIVIMNLPEWQQKGARLLNNQIFRIFYYGSLDRNRGVENLILAVQPLSNVRLILAGKGELVPWISNAKGLKNIYFLGWISLQEIDRITESVHLIPTLYMPTNINQILATPEKFFSSLCEGIPVLVPKGTYMACITKKYQCGLIVDPKDYLEIRDALRFLSTDHILYNKLSQNAADLYSNFFSWEIMKKRLFSIYS